VSTRLFSKKISLFLPTQPLGDPQFGIISSTIPGTTPSQLQFALKMRF